MNDEQLSAAPTQREVEVTPRRPRTWPTWVTLFLILPIGSIAVSAVSLIIGALTMGGPDLVKDSEALQAWIQEISSGPYGILILIAPGQIFFLALAVGAALPSPDSLSKRLGVVRPRHSPRTWVLLCLGTPVVQLVGVLFAQLFFDLSEPSEHMEMLSGLFTGQSGLLGLFLLILFASVMPGLSEELLFRGYVRVGLERLFGSKQRVGWLFNAVRFLAAIILPALLFAIAHGDLMHAAAVLPLGIWFGCLAWWSRSTIPSIFAHLLNNLFAIIVSREAAALMADSDTTEAATAAAAAAELGNFALLGYGVCFILLLTGLVSLVADRLPNTTSQLSGREL